jgi:peptidoglycan/xylan/chitin deacetylase (PgdA/CDA1 family)
MKSRKLAKQRDGLPGLPLERRGEFVRSIDVLTVLLLVAVAASVMAFLLPPVVDQPRTVNAVDPAGGRLYALLPAGAPYSDLGLFYLPAGGFLPHAPRSSVSRETVKETGLMQAYSLPPGRVAFVQDGLTLFVPPSPMPTGPRVPGIVYHGDRGTRKIALTFDDGYGNLNATIDLLTQLRVPATLFPAGAVDATSPTAIRKAMARGFEIGNHSYTHPVPTKIPAAQLGWEIIATDAAVSKDCGTGTVAYFRPPFGDQNVGVQVTAGNLGYLLIQWDRDTLDWNANSSPDQIIARATDGVQGGEIVLFHMQGQYTLQVLPSIVKILRDKGFVLTTVSGVLSP